MSDVVSRLLAAIDEREKAARAVQPLGHNFDMGGNRQDEVFTHGRIRYASEDGMPRRVNGGEQQHFGNWEPDAVLRLCQSHRDIVAIHGSGGRTSLGDDSDPASWRDYCATCGSGEPHEYPTWWPCETLLALARGYGIEDGETK